MDNDGPICKSDWPERDVASFFVSSELREEDLTRRDWRRDWRVEVVVSRVERGGGGTMEVA